MSRCESARAVFVCVFVVHMCRSAALYQRNTTCITVFGWTKCMYVNVRDKNDACRLVSLNVIEISSSVARCIVSRDSFESVRVVCVCVFMRQVKVCKHT